MKQITVIKQPQIRFKITDCNNINHQ